MNTRTNEVKECPACGCQWDVDVRLCPDCGTTGLVRERETVSGWVPAVGHWKGMAGHNARMGENTPAPAVGVPFSLPPKNPTNRPEDVVRVVDYYAEQAGVEPTNADYARYGYWEAVGRQSDARVMAGWCPVGLENSPTFERVGA